MSDVTLNPLECALDEAQAFRSQVDALQAENAKLRELARLRSDRTAPRVIVADGDTDCATGHCECGGCGGAIDCWDRFCRHCGRELED